MAKKTNMERRSFLNRVLSIFRHIPTNYEYVPNTSNEFSQLWRNRYGLNRFQPKSLPPINYEEIINGEVANFSPDCWLDGHIHRFARVEHNSFMEFDSSRRTQEYSESDSETSSYEANVSSPQSYSSSLNPFPMSNVDSSQSYSSTANVLLDLFTPLHEQEAPPPYSDEPPPTYEEAIMDDHRPSVDSDNWIVRRNPLPEAPDYYMW